MKTGISIKSKRTIIGIVCIIAAFLITFGAGIFINKYSQKKIKVPRITQTVGAGEKITPLNLEYSEVSAMDLQSGVVTDPKQIVGKYAVTKIYPGDFITSDKITSNPQGAEEIFASLSGEKVAVSVRASGMDSCLSYKLRSGDIVALSVYSQKEGHAFVPPELKYVYVITTTSSDGTDSDDKDFEGKTETVTLLVTWEQASLITEYAESSDIGFYLVYRGEKENADKYIKAQDEYLNKEKEKEKEECQDSLS